MNIHDIRSLSDIVRHKAEFLTDTGSDVDHDAIAGMLTRVHADVDPDEMEEEDILSTWFDVLVDRLGDRDAIEIHRHVNVPDWDDLVASIEAGATLGCHWSTDPHILSSVYGGHSVEARMSGSTEASSICWFSTFQQNFSYPEEQEVVLAGNVTLVAVVDLQSGVRWQPDDTLLCSAVPYVDDGAPVVDQAEVPAPFQP